VGEVPGIIMKPPKRNNVDVVVAEKVRNDNFRLIGHATDAMRKRHVLMPEVEDVLLSGHHNPAQDEWSESYQTWRYAIEGWTEEGRDLRLAVSFDQTDEVVVITVITPHT